MENHSDVSWVVSTPRSPVMAFIGFAAQAKPVWFESAGASALHIHTLPFGFNPGDGCLTGRGVLITPPFVGPFCSNDEAACCYPQTGNGELCLRLGS